MGLNVQFLDTFLTRMVRLINEMLQYTLLILGTFQTEIFAVSKILADSNKTITQSSKIFQALSQTGFACRKNTSDILP